MKKFTGLIFISTVFLCGGCSNFFDREVFFNTEQHDPVLTLTGTAQLDKNLFRGFVSRTRALNDLSPYNVVIQDTLYIPNGPGDTSLFFLTRLKYDSVPGVKLFLRHNNDAEIQITDYKNGYYEQVLNDLTSAGGTLTLRASAPGFLDASVTASIIEKPDNAGVNFIKNTFDELGNPQLEYEILLHDKSGTDYYLIEFETYDSLTQNWFREPYSFDQSPIVEYTSLGKIVSDVTFSGKSIQFKLRVSPSLSNKYARFVKIAYLSEDIYKFIKSYDAYQETQSNPFSEPISLLSLVSNGVGYFLVLNPVLLKLE